MKCENCNTDNNDSSKFCSKCGSKLEKKNNMKKLIMNKLTMDKQQIIITILAVIGIILMGVVLSYSNVLVPQANLETRNFGAFSISVPDSSNFVLEDQSTQVPENLYFGYLNKGKYGLQVASISFTENKSGEYIGEIIEETDDQKVTIQRNETGDIYFVHQEKPECEVILMGGDLNLLKTMANTIEIHDFNSFRSNMTSTTPTTPSPQSSSSSSSSIEILGGSFSTGSGLEDKTYAEIYVGENHAGESYTVQIYYNRDGNTLNNGNMVPVSVHSDGYIYVSSADAYSLYPDYATINIYNSEGSLLTTKSVSLSPTSGTQTF